MAAKLSDLSTGFRPEISCPELKSLRVLIAIICFLSKMNAIAECSKVKHLRSHAIRIFLITIHPLLIQVFWMLRCVHWDIVTYVSNVGSAVNFRVKQFNQSSWTTQP
jgi:hypothetical protein